MTAVARHRFVDDGRLALAYLGATSGVPVCSWDEDGLGVCDRYRSDPIHAEPVHAKTLAAQEVRRAADDLLADPHERRAMYERADDLERDA